MTTDTQPVIETVEDIGRLVRAGFTAWGELGDVRASRDGDLLMFSYTPRAPEMEVDARVVSIYGSSAVAYAA